MVPLVISLKLATIQVGSLLMGPHGDLSSSSAKGKQDVNIDMLQKQHPMTGPFPLLSLYGMEESGRPFSSFSQPGVQVKSSP